MYKLTIDAVFDGSKRILCSHDSLDHDLEGGDRAQPGYVLPGQGLVDKTSHITGETRASRACSSQCDVSS